MSRLPTLAILGALLLLAGCKDPRKDMNLQPKHEPYGAANVFPDGASARPLVAGTVPRDPANVPSRAWAAPVYEPEVMTPVNAVAGGAIPFPVDRGKIRLALNEPRKRAKNLDQKSLTVLAGSPLSTPSPSLSFVLLA